MECPELVADGAGVVLTVHAQPGAKRTRIVGRHGGACKIAVTSPPVDGRANDAIERTVADVLGVRPGDVTIISGHLGRRKRVAVRGVTLAQAGERLLAAYRR